MFNQKIRKKNLVNTWKNRLNPRINKIKIPGRGKFQQNKTTQTIENNRGNHDWLAYIKQQYIEPINLYYRKRLKKLPDKKLDLSIVFYNLHCFIFEMKMGDFGSL